MRVTVIGAGSWGTALAKHLADKSFPVTLWGREEDNTAQIDAVRENRTFLPGFALPPNLRVTSDENAAFNSAEMIVFVVPSHAFRTTLGRLAKKFPNVPVVSATKGIENDSLKLMSEVLEEFIPKERRHLLTYLSGPSFAREVAARLPTLVSIAGTDASITEQVQHAFATELFRTYRTEDVIGVELGGALKNVIAIAAGASDGLGFGANARAALITRGLAEMTRFVVKRGGHPLTLAGLAGMGDLVLTCTGELSRNRHVGLELGRGRKLEDVLGGMTMVAEGVRTAKSAHELALREQVEMPIVAEVYRVLYEGKDPRKAVTDLMTRSLKHERDEPQSISSRGPDDPAQSLSSRGPDDPAQSLSSRGPDDPAQS